MGPCETLPQGISLLPGIGIFGFGIFVALKWREFQVGTGGAWNAWRSWMLKGDALAASTTDVQRQLY